MSSRAELRAKLLGQKVKTSIVELEDGMQVEIHQLSVGQMLAAMDEEDSKKRVVQYLIDSCYVPGTSDKVFESADYDVLMGLPAGGYYQKLMDAVNSMLLPVQMEVAAKK